MGSQARRGQEKDGRRVEVKASRGREARQICPTSHKPQ